MKQIKRDVYLQKLITRKNNGMIKVITGLRRSGKSYLLFKIYYDYLISTGVPEQRILRLALDDDENEELLDNKKLGESVRTFVKDNQDYYVFLDEIQFVENFEKAINGLNRISNLDIYVTGSNSKFLSTDIKTEFRGRGDEVQVYPLSFSEYFSACGKDKIEGWTEYCTYGGLPMVLSLKTNEQKASYLQNLLEHTYKKDVIEHNNIKETVVLDNLINFLASSIGSLSNPTKLANTFQSVLKRSVSDNTIRDFIKNIKEAFLITAAERYDVKGKKYIGGNVKYYFQDIGIRNSQLNFRQFEITHIMENVIYNELRYRGYNVDVGTVEINIKDKDGKYKRTDTEIDFICNLGSDRIYIQSAFSIQDNEKTATEQKPLLNTKDSFKKIILTADPVPKYRNNEGILIMNVLDFLLSPQSLSEM
jgi:uncharacterized protein